MLKANSLINYHGRTWYPGQEILDIPDEVVQKWLFTGEAVGTMPEPEKEPEPEQEPEPEPPTSNNLQQYTIGELRKMAKESGVTAPKNATKSELITILAGAQA